MKAAGVIGWPVAHSRSPVIHRFWLDALGLDGDYSRFAVHPDQLSSAVRALPALGLAGVNITVPHKLTVLPCLDDLSPIARTIGAVNIVTVTPRGLLAGDNSDAAGFLEPLGNRRFDHAVIIGAGGATRAILAALAGRVARFTILNRSVGRAESLLSALGLPGSARPLPETAPDCDLLVNSSALGMVGQPPLPIAITGRPLVYDIVYAPRRTDLLAQAHANGLETIDGLAMLIGQADHAFRAFYGARPPRDRDAELRGLLA